MGNIAVFAVLCREGRILLVRRAYGHFDWALPGGTVEPGESLRQALEREVKEEIDVHVPFISEGRVFGVSYAAAEYSVAFLFGAELPANCSPKVNRPELSTFGFFTAAEAATLVQPINAPKIASWREWRQRGEAGSPFIIEATVADLGPMHVAGL